MAGLVIAAGVFVLVVAALLGAFVAAQKMPDALMRLRLQRRIREVNATPEGDTRADDRSVIIKGEPTGPFASLEKIVRRSERGTAFGLWVQQSGLKVSPGTIVVAVLGLGAAVGIATVLLVHAWWAPFTGFAAGAMLPVLVVQTKRRSRLGRFEEQFPEALDLMARAVKAGHAFVTGIRMVAEELGEPVGPEFKKAFDEQNFGLPLKESLDNLSIRIPLLDVRFFVTAVLIQRETGGNLSEILENLAAVVRERFKILRQVRVHTAHGRFTGYVLLGLPPALAIALMFINPDHMNLLFREPIGHQLLAIAAVMQIIGYFWIRKVIKIEV